MKKEIKELLEMDDGYMKINELFTLHHWRFNESTDFLGREGDYLEITLNSSGRKGSRMLEFREVDDIIKEIEFDMKDMMDEYASELVKRFANGKDFLKLRDNGEEFTEIKFAREAKGMTQEQLSKLINVPKRTIESWEEGIRKPTPWAKDLILEKIMNS